MVELMFLYMHVCPYRGKFLGGGGQKSGGLLKFIVTDHIATVVPDKSAKKYTKKICRDNHPLYIPMLAF